MSKSSVHAKLRVLEVWRRTNKPNWKKKKVEVVTAKNYRG